MLLAFKIGWCRYFLNKGHFYWTVREGEDCFIFRSQMKVMLWVASRQEDYFNNLPHRDTF